MTQIEVIEEYGARLATKANELTHRLKPKESPSVALFESAYLLIYLTLRPLREQWNQFMRWLVSRWKLRRSVPL